MLKQIYTGGQTGVDRAAIDAAIENSISYCGWCPKGRIDENGKIPAKYDSLKEIDGNFDNDKENYDTRTKYNIRDSQATIVLVPGIPLPSKIKDGTLLTIEEVKKQNKPYLLIDILRDEDANLNIIKDWIYKNNIEILNIAGPRESSFPGIYEESYNFMMNLFPFIKTHS